MVYVHGIRAEKYKYYKCKYFYIDIQNASLVSYSYNYLFMSPNVSFQIMIMSKKTARECKLCRRDKKEKTYFML